MDFKRADVAAGHPSGALSAFAASLQHNLLGSAAGRLLVADCARAEAARSVQGQDCASSGSSGGGSTASGKAAQSSGTSTSSSGRDENNAAGGGGLQIILQDPAIRDMPVPTVFLGGLPAPIPAGACPQAAWGCCHRHCVCVAWQTRLEPLNCRLASSLIPACR